MSSVSGTPVNYIHCNNLIDVECAQYSQKGNLL